MMPTMASRPAIEVHDLRKSYGELEAVRGIDFSVQRGEIYGLLGPNGAGKTSTVEILEGYRERTSGRSACSATTRRRARASCAGASASCCRVSGIYSQVRVARSSPTSPASTPTRAPSTRSSRWWASATSATSGRGGSRAVSGGASISPLALIGDPELIFLDEPTTGFDPAARRTAWQTIRSLKDLGKTVLLTTHYLDEAQELADRVAIIKGGQILAEGSPAELGVGAARATASPTSPTASR